jgi:hypothetical protein
MRCRMGQLVLRSWHLHAAELQGAVSGVAGGVWLGYGLQWGPGRWYRLLDVPAWRDLVCGELSLCH